jgi:hypothetical protein
MVKYFRNGRLSATMPFSLHATPPQGPEVWLVESEFDFGTVRVGESRTYRLLVENLGRADLRISLESDDPAFSVAAQSVTVRPRTQESIAVTFAPTEAADYRGRITLTTNDSDERTLTVSVRGRGTP